MSMQVILADSTFSTVQKKISAGLKSYNKPGWSGNEKNRSQ